MVRLVVRFKCAIKARIVKIKMSTVVFQVVSHLDICNDKTSDEDFSAMVMPMAPYLLLPGNIGNPWLTCYSKFLEWTSTHWERVWFVPGAVEYSSTGDGGSTVFPTTEEVDLQCRTLAAQHHNVRCLQCSTDRAFPGLVLVGASCWPKCAQDTHAAYLQRAAKADSLVITHAPLDTLALPCLCWVNGSTNPRSLLLSSYDPTFYLDVMLPPGTVSFTHGTDAFPSFARAHVTNVDDKDVGIVCFYCGHRNHTKFVCPLIQCNSCASFGHSERVCSAVPRTTSEPRVVQKQGETQGWRFLAGMSCPQLH